MVDSASNLRFFCLARCHLSNVVRLNRRSENQARVTCGHWISHLESIQFQVQSVVIWWTVVFSIKTWWIEHWKPLFHFWVWGSKCCSSCKSMLHCRWVWETGQWGRECTCIPPFACLIWNILQNMIQSCHALASTCIAVKDLHQIVHEYNICIYI